MKTTLLVSVSMLAIAAVASAEVNEAPFARTAPVIDGNPDDAAWQSGRWIELTHSILGSSAAPDDFSGRYKVVWTPEYLYLLAEITDDILIDSTADPLVAYWDDDTLELFLDEDASGGLHRDTDNAYAYHIALDNQVVDIGADGEPATFPEHLTAVWRRSADDPNRLYWEVRIALYAEGAAAPRQLQSGETLGFMVAYCDADSPDGRKHFYGDVEIEPVNGDRNLGYIDASVFGSLTLAD